MLFDPLSVVVLAVIHPISVESFGYFDAHHEQLQLHRGCCTFPRLRYLDELDVFCISCKADRPSPNAPRRSISFARYTKHIKFIKISQPGECTASSMKLSLFVVSVEIYERFNRDRMND